MESWTPRRDKAIARTPVAGPARRPSPHPSAQPRGGGHSARRSVTPRSATSLTGFPTASRRLAAIEARSPLAQMTHDSRSAGMSSSSPPTSATKRPVAAGEHSLPVLHGLPDVEDERPRAVVHLAAQLLDAGDRVRRRRATLRAPGVHARRRDSPRTSSNPIRNSCVAARSADASAGSATTRTSGCSGVNSHPTYAEKDPPSSTFIDPAMCDSANAARSRVSTTRGPGRDQPLDLRRCRAMARPAGRPTTAGARRG